MKKLMFAALVACAAAFSASASEYKWGFASDESMLPDGSDYLDGGTAMLYLGTVSFADGAWNTSGATFITSGGMTSNYNFGHQDDAGMPSNDAIVGTGGQAYTLILLSESGISNLAGYVGDGKYYYLYSGTSETGYYLSGTDRVDYGKMIYNNPVTAWSEAKGGDIPEPTSGLLLLVGGAMLALRRLSRVSSVVL